MRTTVVCLSAWLLVLGYAVNAQTVTLIISRDGGFSSLVEPQAIAVDAAGNVYVVSDETGESFRISPRGAVSVIQTGIDLDSPQGAIVDPSGTLYVSGFRSHNVLRIPPDGTAPDAEILDSSGDGMNVMRAPRNMAVSTSGNVYVAASGTDNVFEVRPDGTVTQIIDGSGDGFNALDNPFDVAVDASGTVYVTGAYSDNVFKISPNGTITEILDANGDGSHALKEPRGVAVDAAGNVYVSGFGTDNAFAILPSGTIIQIIDGSGDGVSPLRGASAVAIEPSGSVYVAGYDSDNVFAIQPDGTIVGIFDASGDGASTLDGSSALAVTSSGLVYVAGRFSDNALAFSPRSALSDAGGLILPGFEADVAAGGPTTLFAVRNTTDEPILAVADYLGTVGTEPLRSESLELAPQATLSRNVGADLSDLEIEDGTARGLIRISEPGDLTEPGDFEASSLTGDFFRVDPANGFATGGRLIRPADFCLQQEVRFVDFGGGSTLRMLVDRPRGDVVPSLSYTAYDETGVEIASGVHFTSRYLTEFEASDVVEGSGFGTLQFDFTNSGGGWVSARHSAFGRFSAEIEGSCMPDASSDESAPPGTLSATAQLVVPGFEVAIDEPDGPTILFALRNTADEPVSGVINYMGLGGAEPQISEPFALGPRETLTRNVGNELAGLDGDNGVVRGLILIAGGDETMASALVGDYFRVDAANDFAAGGLLVRPAELCLEQEVRFVDFGAGSTIRVLVDRPRGDEVPSFAFTTYDEAGLITLEGDVYTSNYVTTLDAEAFAGEVRFGTIRLDFLGSGGGWASVENSAFGAFSVEIEGACLDR